MELWIITGKREDGSVSDLFSTITRTRAKEFVKNLRALTKFNSVFERKLMDEFVVAYYANNPHSSAPSKPEPNEEFAALSKLISTKQATTEDKKRFRWVQAAHIQNIEAWKKKFVLFARLSTEYESAYKQAEKWWRDKHYRLSDAFMEMVPYWRKEFVEYDCKRIGVLE
jgi:hypothetical protein